MKKDLSPIFFASHIKPVPVIASFDSTGTMQPLYVRIRGTEYKIVKSSTPRREADFLHYECSLVENNMIKLFILIYSIKDTAWFVPSEYLS